jgi:GNAT superfamily N-acetyltransferase
MTPFYIMEIEQITPQLTWRLRRDELYPGEYMFNMEMEEDNHGIHFGGFLDNKLVAVVSLFHTGTDFQFRKFAVQADQQGKGIGRELLQYITDFAKAEGGIRIWCNARDTAINFYIKAGFTSTGEVFERKGHSFEILEKTI